MNTDITVELVANKRSDFRSKLSKIIEAFESSGNGDSNLIDPESWVEWSKGNNNYGHFDKDLYQDDIRKRFLQGQPPALLYFWDSKQLMGELKQTLQTLDKDHLANSKNVPSAMAPSASKRKRDSSGKEAKEKKGGNNDVGSNTVKSMERIGCAEFVKSETVLVDKILELRRQIKDEENKEEPDEDYIAELQQFHDDLKEQYNSVKARIKSMNTD